MEQGNVTSVTEYPQAVRSIQGAKNILWLLAGICIIVQLAVFILVGIVGTTDALHSPQESTTHPTSAKDTVESVAEARFLEDSVYRVALSATRFLVMVFVAVLALSLLLGVLVSLVGRLGGVAPLMSAFYWSLLLLALLTPWQQIMREAFAFGAMFSIDELTRWTQQIRGAWGARDVGAFQIVTYYVRFAAYPVLSLAIWGLVQMKCSRGFKRITLQSVSANY